MKELDRNKELADQKLSGKELYDLEKRQREAERNKEKRKEQIKEAPKKISKYGLYALIIILPIAGVVWLGWTVAHQPKLPPVSAQGHTETMPDAHITNKVIPDSMQRHMLEHADGKNKPGIIIQYNCKKYACEPDLITKLTELVKKYPDNVYLAPSDYDGKIILTKSGSIKILENFDEKTIKDFIGS